MASENSSTRPCFGQLIFLSLVVIFALVVLPKNCLAQTYGIESAKIEFDSFGSLKERLVVYFDDWGKEMVWVLWKRVGKKEIKATLIWKKGRTTFLDHVKKTVRVFKGKPKELTLNPHTSRALLQRLGFRRDFPDTVAGKSCEVYLDEKPNSLLKIWRWNGIDLRVKMISSRRGFYATEATSVKENIIIPKKLFEYPVTYRNISK